MFSIIITGVFRDKLPYLDPGSGSIILQLVLAALLGAGAVIGIYWKKVKNLLFRKKEDQPDTENEENDQ